MSQQHSNGSTRAVSTTEKVQIGVIGGGAWGTALAMHCTRAGHASLVWALEADVVRDINDPAVRENSVYLKVCAMLCIPVMCQARACSSCGGSCYSMIGWLPAHAVGARMVRCVHVLPLASCWLSL